MTTKDERSSNEHRAVEAADRDGSARGNSEYVVGQIDDVCFLSTLPYYKATLESYEGEEVIAAFMVYDLLSVLPKTITNSKGGVHKLHIEVCSSTNHCWCLFWGDEEIQIGWCERISFLHLIEDATEWLLSNGYKLNL